MGYLEKPDEMRVAILLREMGWDYQQYLNQPQWLINHLLAYMRAEAEHVNSKNRK